MIVTLLLFVVWSNSFIAMSYLLGAETGSARFDWVSLAGARFVPAAAICAVWCFGFRRLESVAILRGHWRRLLPCGVLVVPAYNLAIHYGQERGVPAPVASLTTTLVPLFVLALAAGFLSHRQSSMLAQSLAQGRTWLHSHRVPAYADHWQSDVFDRTDAPGDWRRTRAP